jgi:hypothetical protein
MNISLSGKLYVHFIKSVFEEKQKIGIDIIIDRLKSDIQVIDGLTRLKLLNNNKIFVKNINIKIPVKLYDKKYTCTVFLIIDSNNDVILENIIDVLYEKIPKIIDNKLYIPKYSMNKNKTTEKIMEIISNM